MKKAFTIVELLLVLSIIAVLMGIITTAASSSIKASRSRRAEALCTLVQAGLATYFEQEGKWPIAALNGDTISPKTNQEGPGRRNDPDKIVLTGQEVRECVLALVQKTKDNNPVMDISGLFVSRSEGELLSSGGGKADDKAINTGGGNARAGYGLDFMSAIHGTKWSQKKMKTSEMYFGYPDPETGYFLRFKMVYSIPADTITVSTQR